MEKTYEMLKTLIIPGTEQMSLEQISVEYKGTLSPSLLALAFKKVYSLALSVSNRYYGLNPDDIASFTLEKLDYCLCTYTEGSKFSTYFTTVLKNKFREETESLNTHKRKAIFLSDSYESMVESGFDIADEVSHNQNIIESLKEYNLTEREIEFCLYIIDEVPSKQIGDKLGVSQMTLTNMRKSLRKKLSPLALMFV